MGMYTEIVVKATIKPNLPEDVLKVLDYMFGQAINVVPDVLPEHPFFTLPRWTHIGKGCSYYHHPQAVNSVDKEYPDWYFFSRSDIKNYNGEIEAFFDWFSTICGEDKGTCIGYSWYEEDSVPTPMFMKCGE